MPKDEQHLINGIRRQNKPSLLDIAIHLCQDEETALKALEPLLERGFVEENIVEKERYYSVTYPPNKGQSLLNKLAEKQRLNKRLQKVQAIHDLVFHLFKIPC